MKTIPISGVIGWDVSPNDIRQALAEAKGEAVEVQISSPGGFVTDGLEIYNLIRAYEGQVTTRIIGLAASMASYIALAGDRVVAEPNAVYMIHNALGGATGDHRDLRKTADVFEGFSIMLARAYASKIGKSIDYVRGLMDAETWYFGDESKTAGFVDEMAGDSTDDRSVALLAARASASACSTFLREFTEQDSAQRLAALIKLEPAGVAGSAAAAPAAVSQVEEVCMDLDKLKAEHPDVYAQALDEGKAIERKRREELLAFRGKSEAVDAAIEAAIADGRTYGEALPEITAAAVKSLAGENPPEVGSREAERSTLTDEDREAARIFGMSEEEYRKFAVKE